MASTTSLFDRRQAGERQLAGPNLARRTADPILDELVLGVHVPGDGSFVAMADEEHSTRDDEVDLVALSSALIRSRPESSHGQLKLRRGARRAESCYRSVEAEARDILAESPEREPVSMAEV